MNCVMCGQLQLSLQVSSRSTCPEPQISLLQKLQEMEDIDHKRNQELKNALANT